MGPILCLEMPDTLQKKSAQRSYPEVRKVIIQVFKDFAQWLPLKVFVGETLLYPNTPHTQIYINKMKCYPATAS